MTGVDDPIVRWLEAVLPTAGAWFAAACMVAFPIVLLLAAIGSAFQSDPDEDEDSTVQTMHDIDNEGTQA